MWLLSASLHPSSSQCGWDRDQEIGKITTFYFSKPKVLLFNSTNTEELRIGGNCHAMKLDIVRLTNKFCQKIDFNFKWCLFWSLTMIDQGRAGRLVLETICVNHHLIHLRRGNNQCMEVSASCVDTQVMIMMSQPPSHCLQVTSSPPSQWGHWTGTIRPSLPWETF